MAPIEIQKVIEVSSEDAKYPASNLPSGSKWMNSKLDQSGKATVELLLKCPTRIHYIDLGYQNVAKIEIQVSLSSWKSYHDPLTLLSPTVLQTLQDVRAGINKNGCRMFNFDDHLNQEIAKQKWDKVKLIIHQPHTRNKQMGIEFLRLGTLSSLKSCDKASVNEDESDNGKPSWKDSPIGKLMSTTQNASLLGLKLGDKFRKLSSERTGGAYSRTAKMIMSSKLASLKAKEKNISPYQERKLDERRNNIRNGLGNVHQKSPKTNETVMKTSGVQKTPLRSKKEFPNYSENFNSNNGIMSANNKNAGIIVGRGKLNLPLAKTSPKPVHSVSIPSCSSKGMYTMKKRPVSKSKGIPLSPLKPKNTTRTDEKVEHQNKHAKAAEVENLKILTSPKDFSDRKTQSIDTTPNPNDVESFQQITLNHKTPKSASTMINTPTAERISRFESPKAVSKPHSVDSGQNPNLETRKTTSLNTATAASNFPKPPNRNAVSGDDCLAVQNIDNDVQIINNCETPRSDEIVYTDEQIKQLKRAIKKFFNKLDMDSFNLETLRIKDLRKRFEETHAVKLNKDARMYFREITARFRTLLENCRKYKENKSTSSAAKVKNEPVKRKTNELSTSSPAKLSRSVPLTRPAVPSASSDYQQCPICFGFIEKSLIEGHAAFCGQDDDLPDLNASNRHLTEEANGTVVDCSENSCLSRVEQERWIQFSQEPKPFHQRLNTSSFVGCVLVKCPSCGLKYKSSEIEVHCNDCTDKVNSGSTRMGLYLIDENKKRSGKKNSNSNNSISLID